jgi:hypothetical protein
MSLSVRPASQSARREEVTARDQISIYRDAKLVGPEPVTLNR